VFFVPDVLEKFFVHRVEADVALAGHDEDAGARLGWGTI
jgi:hypothetical protein